MSLTTSLARCLFAIVCVLACSRDAAALSYTMVRDDQLLRESDGVALVHVTAATAVPARGETRYRITPVRTLRGPAIGQSSSFALPGYETDDAALAFPGIPLLRIGQDVLIFYTRRDDGVLQAVQLTLGMFFPTKAGGNDVYVRYLDGARDGAKGHNAEYAAVRDADGFERWIRAAATGKKGSLDYLLRDDLAAKFNLIQVAFADPQFPPGNARWSQFEQGTTMRWYAGAGGQANMTRNEFDQLAAGIAGWVNDPGSLVLMTYAGIGSSNENRDANVTWNDPQNAIPGDYDCSPNGGGILGSGGSAISSQRHTYDGVQWYTLRRGTLVTQPSAGCFFDEDQGRSGIEFFVHEIGHTLGFAHSCGTGVPTSCAGNPVADEATMRSTLHGDGRGATLMEDDIAAVRFVYEDATAPAPSADLSVVLTAAPSPVPLGASLIFTSTVSNAGPSASTSVQWSLTVPAGVTVTTIAAPGWNCAQPTITLTCSRASINAGSSASLSITMEVPLDYEGPALLASQATVSSAVSDPVSGNNSASRNVPVDFTLDRIFGNGFE